MVRDVEAPVEQRPPAGAGHGKLVDRGVGVALGLQRRVGDGVASGETNCNVHNKEFSLQRLIESNHVPRLFSFCYCDALIL